jgi:hypothetical protein
VYCFLCHVSFKLAARERKYRYETGNRPTHILRHVHFSGTAGAPQTVADDTKAIEKAASSAFAAAFRKEAGRGIKQVHIAYLHEVCTGG